MPYGKPTGHHPAERPRKPAPMSLESEPTGTLSTDPKVYLWRACMVILVLVGASAQLYTSSNYLGRSEYERDRNKSIEEKADNNRVLTGINNTLIRIDEKMKGDDMRDRQLADHEKRIRDLERHIYGKSP